MTRRTTTEIGDAFESRVHDYFRAEIAEDCFWAKKSCCRIFHKKGYHSRDRNSKIVFDVSVEVYLPGASEFSCLVLIECKDYKHAVPVDDVEEFFTKVQQVAAANAKAVLASTASFQSGTREFAKSKGIGLLRYFDRREFKWELRRSPSALARSTVSEDAHLVEQGLNRQDFHSILFDLYLQSPVRATNSLWDFFEDLVMDSGLTTEQIRRVVNSRKKLSNQVPFLEKVDLEAQATEILATLEYSGGEVSLENLCALEKLRTGLEVKVGGQYKPDNAVPALGRITFDPPLIEVFALEESNYGRERFTLAHELSHYLLSHGKYMRREYCEDGDFLLERTSAINGSDIARMEFQANYLAAVLLMPRAHFLEEFWRLVRILGLSDRGYGALYVDNQVCNLQNLEFVTGQLMRRFGVSRTAAKIRLESIGLLRDAR